MNRRLPVSSALFSRRSRMSGGALSHTGIVLMAVLIPAAVIALALGLGLGLSCTGDCSDSKVNCGKKCKRLSWCKGKKCDKGSDCKDNVCVAHGKKYSCANKGTECKEDVNGKFEEGKCMCWDCVGKTATAAGKCTPVADGGTGAIGTKKDCTDGGCESPPGTQMFSCQGGACLPDDNGTYKKDKCKCWNCVGKSDTQSGVCTQVADKTTGADFTDKKDCTDNGCQNRFQCDVGAGTCSKANDDTTGYTSKTACQCYDCKTDGDTKSCVTTPNTTGTFTKSECTKQCVSGKKLYGCAADGAAPYMCKEMDGGTWDDPTKCSCWSCTGDAATPAEQKCAPVSTGQGDFGTEAICKSGEASGGKCGWGWTCPQT